MYRREGRDLDRCRLRRLILVFFAITAVDLVVAIQEASWWDDRGGHDLCRGCQLVVDTPPAHREPPCREDS